MFLLLSTINTENQTREFSCWLSKMETAFDFLSYVASTGEQILKAELIDNGHRLLLPTRAFEGTSFSRAIQQLEQDWQQILSTTVN